MSLCGLEVGVGEHCLRGCVCFDCYVHFGIWEEIIEGGKMDKESREGSMEY